MSKREPPVDFNNGPDISEIDPLPPADEALPGETLAEITPADAPVKRGRGRPRKNPDAEPMTTRSPTDFAASAAKPRAPSGGKSSAKYDARIAMIKDGLTASHFALGVRFDEQRLFLKDEHSQAYAEAINNILVHYKVEFLKGDNPWSGLIRAMGLVYGPIIVDRAMSVLMKRLGSLKQKQAPPANVGLSEFS